MRRKAAIRSTRSAALLDQLRDVGARLLAPVPDRQDLADFTEDQPHGLCRADEAEARGLWGAETPFPHAARAKYSWMSPPSTSRRPISSRSAGC